MKKIFLLPIATVFFLAGCRKYLDINTDPVNPQTATAQLVIAPIINRMAIDAALDYRQVMCVTQNWGSFLSLSAWERHGYVSASDVSGTLWRMAYADLGQNLEVMINDGVDNQKYQYAGIGYAVKAWAYQITTDMYGPIILDAAFDPTLLAFPYQDQDTVYRKVRTWAHTALQYLDQTGPVDYTAALNAVSGDNLYRGNMARWKKFVYGLLALQFSHLVNKSAFTTAYADSVIRYVDSSFVDESDDATIFFNASNADDSNPFGTSPGNIPGSTTVAYSSYGAVGLPIVKLLTGGVRGTAPDEPKASVDPRLTRMLSYSSADSIYRGVVATEGSAGDAPCVLGIVGSDGLYPGKYVFTDVARWPVMTYSQLQFAKAEAYYYKGDLSSAYQAYLNGINGHMTFINTYGLTDGYDKTISASEISSYLLSSEVVQSSDSLKLADIMGQKYIAQWGWAGMEQWCDLRKYHYDSTVFRTYTQLTASQLADQNNGQYAYRFRPRYNSEYVWNAEELQKWGALDAAYMTYETWFTKQ
ncbi:MAG: SusD/RagB family nutrient-binding outer membrane lipoprotein [Chitinophagaceae bacterium]